LNWTHQPADCAGDVNFLDQSLNTVKKTREALLATRSQNGKIKVYVHVFLKQNAGQNHKTSENITKFQYLGTALTN
jgi:hypothetical protein